jgi:hypothetical protein
MSEVSEYPKVWLPIYCGHDEVVIDGERQVTLDPNADHALVVFQEGGYCFFSKKTHDRAGRSTTQPRENHAVELQAKGLYAFVPREDWPVWLPAKIEATVDSGARLGPS